MGFDTSDPETVLGEAGVEKLSQLSDFSYSFEKIIKILRGVPASSNAHSFQLREAGRIGWTASRV